MVDDDEAEDIAKAEAQRLAFFGFDDQDAVPSEEQASQADDAPGEEGAR